jgi:H+/Cl- antiporter ClcA
VVCALSLASLAYFIDQQVLGSGKQLMTGILFSDQKYLPWYLPILRFIGTVLSFSSGVAGGIFAPSLSAGASIGSAMSAWFHLSATDSNLLILSGMVGFLTGVTRTPFTSAILILEMTDRHNVIFHLMLAGLVASLASLLVDKHSFYDHLAKEYIHELDQDEMKTLVSPSPC